MLARASVAKLFRQACGDMVYAELRRRMLSLTSNRSAFTRIYRQSLWDCPGTVSGAGSTLDNTRTVRKALALLLREIKAKSILDAGCGDFNWMREVDLRDVTYIGVDVVPQLIEHNRQVYGSPGRQFVTADITKDHLPRVDVALCRHCLIHLTNRQVLCGLRNFRSSGTIYLAATTFPDLDGNKDIWPGSYRPLNLQKEPFNLPEPIWALEDCTGGNEPRSMLGIWRLSNINKFI